MGPFIFHCFVFYWGFHRYFLGGFFLLMGGRGTGQAID